MSEPTSTTGTNLAPYTTLQVGGPAAQIIEAATEDQIIEQVERFSSADEPLLILGGGSNVVIADAGWPGTALLVRSQGIEQADACGASEFTVAAGQSWDGFVAEMVQQGYSGIEALSGIPGLVGATPIQNVGAYGQEVAETIVRIRAWDRDSGRVAQLRNEDCGFSYRDSRFKQDPDRFVILAVTFGLRSSNVSSPIRYGQLANALRVGVGDRAPLADTRETVLQLRREKGMVCDPADPDTRSAGSFFMNPILTPEQAEALPDYAPAFPTPDGVKTSAAWLIEDAGFGAGYGTGPARLSSKHTLALTNADGATTEDVLQLAREIRAGVEESFGVTLRPEPTLIGCSL